MATPTYFRQTDKDTLVPFATSKDELYEKMEAEDLAFCKFCIVVVEPMAGLRPWDLDVCPFCGRDVE